MEYVFGPVLSRRLGKSLGIDPIPLKTCNWNCVYCQLGRTSPLTNKRREYIPRQVIFEEVEKSLEAHKEGEIDWVTIVGSGEPTLHIGLGWLIRKIKDLTSLPVAVITNGALLHAPRVRWELLPADAVLPSLDAGEPVLYKKINRPWPLLKFEHVVEGLVSFRDEYPGNLWIEVMLVEGINDSQQALLQIARILEKVRPDQVHLNQPVRPPAEAWVLPPGEAEFLRAAEIFGEIARVIAPVDITFHLSEDVDIVHAILNVISRHPMCESDLVNAIQRWKPESVKESLRSLQFTGQAQVVERFGKRYWSAANANYSE